MSHQSSLPTPRLGQQRRVRQGPGWRRGRPRATTYVAVAAVLLAPAMATQALAASPLPTPPHDITIFPQRDFISTTGWDAGKNLNFEVRRGGALIGTAAGTVTQLPPDPLDPAALPETVLEVNHPGGVCWDNSTPDLLPGDEVVVFDTGDTATGPSAQGQSAINVTAARGTAVALGADGVRNDFQVHGTASDSSGKRLPEANIEQRVVNPNLLGLVGKRDIRATFDARNSGVIAWDPAAGPTSWVATYLDIGPDVAAAAAAGQTRALAWHETTAAGDRLGITIYEAGEVAGPGMPECPAAASDAVTATTPDVVNQAAVAAGGPSFLQVQGVSFDASAVSVSVSACSVPDCTTLGASASAAAILTNPAAAGPPTTLPGSQTWTANVPMAGVAVLADGPLLVQATYTRVTAGTPPASTRFQGAPRRLIKDTIAPGTPTVNPPGGTYVGAQSVSVTPGTGTDKVRYTLGAATVADPKPTSNAVTGQLLITSSQTLKVVGFDANGNASPVTTATYTITGPPAPPVVPVTPPAPAVVVLPAAPQTGVVAAVPPSPVVKPASPPRPPVVPATRASAPRIPSATAGKPGGKVTARVSWLAPVSDGGSKITSYRVVALKLSATGKVLRSTTAGSIRPAARSAVLRLSAGKYRFRVVALNAVGASAMSARSNAVRAR